MALFPVRGWPCFLCFLETIRRWWYGMGQPAYPEARQLLITADSGGSNGLRVRLWKTRNLPTKPDWKF